MKEKVQYVKLNAVLCYSIHGNNISYNTKYAKWIFSSELVVDFK